MQSCRTTVAGCLWRLLNSFLPKYDPPVPERQTTGYQNTTVVIYKWSIRYVLVQGSRCWYYSHIAEHLRIFFQCSTSVLHMETIFRLTITLDKSYYNSTGAP